MCQTEFAIITIMANLVIDGWLCTIYIPKTSRRLVGWINILDLSELKDSLIIFQSLNVSKEFITNYKQLEDTLLQKSKL